MGILNCFTINCSEMTYQLVLNVQGSDGTCAGLEPNNSAEAIEYAIRFDTSREGHWIPIILSYYDNAETNSMTSINIVRGYQTPTVKEPSDKFIERVNVCGDALLSGAVQFRWMGTADLDGFNRFRSDMWALAMVTAIYITANERVTLIQENFNTNTLK